MIVNLTSNDLVLNETDHLTETADYSKTLDFYYANESEDVEEPQELNNINDTHYETNHMDACIKTIKIVTGLLSLGGIATTIYFGVKEIENESPRTFAACALANGISTSTLFHLVMPEITLAIPWITAEKTRIFFHKWSYGVLFFTAQWDLNFGTPETKIYSDAGFVWAAGLLAIGGIWHICTRLPSDSPTYSEAPEIGSQLIPLLYNTRYSPLKLLDLFHNISQALVAEVGYWAFLNKDFKNDFFRVGFVGNTAHFYAFSHLAEAITRILDDKRENDLKNWRLRSKKTPLWHLNALCWMRNSIELAPFYCCFILPLLNVPSQSNVYLTQWEKIANLAIMSCLGATYGSLHFLKRREFENPDGKEHVILKKVKKSWEGKSDPLFEEDTKPSYFKSCWSYISTSLPWLEESREYIANRLSQQTWGRIHRYALPVIALIALDCYMGAILGTNEWSPQIGIPIILLLFFSHFTFAGSVSMVEKFDPSLNAHWSLNEIAFRNLNPGLVILTYLFFRIQFKMNDEQLMNMSRALFIGACASWSYWGAGIGLHLAHYTHKKPHLPPGMTNIELGIVSSHLLKHSS